MPDLPPRLAAIKVLKPALAAVLALAAGPAVAAAQDAPRPGVVGTYVTEDGSLLEIVPWGERSVYYRPGSGRLRVLGRDSTGRYVVGPTLLSTDSVVLTLEPVASGGSGSDLLVRRAGGGTSRARRVHPYATERASIPNGDVALAGTLFLPAGPGPHPGVILVHGSGPQDRWGPFGYARIVAGHLARAGFAVLAYDKRGVGGSSGDWRSAGFGELASDASAALGWLGRRPDVCDGAVGVWGISQAGWVAARATRLEPTPAFVALFSAGGAGVTVAEQNSFNVAAELAARGEPPSVVEDAGAAWEELYERVEGKGAPGSRLDSLVAALRERGVPDGLLPPDLEGLERADPPAWYRVLDLRYDPLPDWQAYEGPVLAVFGGRDAATPTHRIVERLGRLEKGGPGRITTRVFDGADHFMLESRTGSARELGRLRRFVPGVFTLLTRWTSRVAATGGCGPRP